MKQILLAIGLFLGLASNSFAQNLTCPQLKSLKLPDNTAIISAEEIAVSDSAPARCKVSGTIDQTIGFEVNLPANWNNKLLVIGIGGNAGAISDTSIGWKKNYATATTDRGHKGNSGDTSWALNNPKAEADFAWRAFHLTTVTAKEISSLNSLDFAKRQVCRNHDWIALLC